MLRCFIYTNYDLSFKDTLINNYLLNNYMIGHILNIIHFVLVFIPVLIYFVPKKYFKNYLKYLFLILTLVPVQWNVFNKCFLTQATKNTGGLEGNSFSRVYLRWLYEPILNLVGLKMNHDNNRKMLHLHYGVNVVLMWYFIFFK